MTDKTAEPGGSIGPPLWITPLSETAKTSDTKKPAERYYRTRKRLVCSSPNLADSTYGEIETCLEEFVEDERVLWRHIAVRGVPEGVLHGSFRIPDEAATENGESGSAKVNANDPILCWAAFPDRPHHKMLFFLSSPEVLNFWDVYPENEEGQTESFGGGEGHSVALPFEARAVFPLGEGNGVLLQRQETVEDILQYEAAKHSNWFMQSSSQDDDDDDFVLTNPPKPVRLGTIMTSPSSVDIIEPPSPQLASLPAPIASCYSLHHPLEEALPVSVSRRGLSPNILSDAHEKLIFVGTAKWTDREDVPQEKLEYAQTICVTFHTQLKRHAVWALEEAPPPPLTLPLWKISEKQRKRGEWDDTLGLMHDPHIVDHDDLELLGVIDSETARHAEASRNEALADALGVRTSSRKKEDAGNTGRRRSRLSGVAPSSYLTPPPGSKKSRASLSEKESEKNDLSSTIVDGSLADASRTTKVAESRHYTKFSTLHTLLSRRLIYEEDLRECTGAEAIDAFLASDRAGSGTLSLCLLSPSGDAANPMLLRWLSLCPRRVESPAGSMRSSSRLGRTDGHRLTAAICDTVHCMSAKPLQSTPIPTCFLPLPSRQKRRILSQLNATDILVLTRCPAGDDRTQLVLYRETVPVVECAFRWGINDSVGVKVLDIANPVRDRVDVIVEATGEQACVRTSLSLQFPDDPLTDAALAAIDASVLGPHETKTGTIERVLKLRADCARLVQEMVAYGDQSHAESVSWEGLVAILSATIQLELFGKRSSFSEISTKSFHGDGAWSALLQSEYHRSFLAGNEDKMYLKPFHNRNVLPCGRNFEWASGLLTTLEPESLPLGSTVNGARPGEAFTPLSSLIFDSLHLLYEESKLSRRSMTESWLDRIGILLVEICFQIDGAIACSSIADKDSLPNMRDFLDHYRRDIGIKRVDNAKDVVAAMDLASRRDVDFRSAVTSFVSPPCFRSWVDMLMKHSDSDTGTHSFFAGVKSSDLNASCKMIRALHRSFSVLFSSIANKSQIEKDRAVVDILVQEGIETTADLCNELPIGLCIPLLEVLHRCREEPAIKNSQSSWSRNAWSLIDRQDLDKQPMDGTLIGSLLSAAEDKDSDGLVPAETSSSLLFPKDNRMHEVGRLLRSSRPVFLKVPRAVEVSDHDYERLKQEELLLLVRRTLALPLGRGMLTFGSLKPVPAEPLPLPELSLSGRFPPHDATVAVDSSNCPTEFKVWPEFHNAVAAGLRLPSYNERVFGTIGQITRTWIAYNRSSGQEASPSEGTTTQGNADAGDTDRQPSHAFGGLLMALGLRGHLSRLALTDIYDYLTTDNNATTTVGMLLGLAAEKRGTCDTSVTKMLCLHIPSLFPQSFASYDVSKPAQTAAVSGIGLLYLGSSHRMMTEFLLEEIGRRPESEIDPGDREAYTLSCGIALGMVNLAKGKRGTSIDHVGDGVGAGLSDLDLESRLHRFVVGGVDFSEYGRRQEAADRANGPGIGTGEMERCSRVFEGNAINVDVTAPAAILALALMYLKSGNQAVASSVSLPDTHFLLENVRPDLLLLRVVAKSMILWDDVSSSFEWTEDQLPPVVTNVYGNMRRTAEKIRDYANLDSATTPVDPESKAGRLASQFGPDVDKKAVRQIYAYTVAGACFSIGLRYAGTGDTIASRTIIRRLIELRTLRDEVDPVSTALKPEQSTLGMCLGCASLGLGLVNAGTGDLEALRVLKMIRWRCDETVRHGDHMAYGAAIGLLFLGGGTCTVGREAEDIAFLIMSLFPRFPSKTTDNQYHLQALRHCYALAVKHRVVEAVDADTGKAAVLPVEIYFEDQEIAPQSLTVPGLLLNTSSVARQLRVVSDQYYPLSLDLNGGSSGRIFFVKKRGGGLAPSQNTECRRTRPLRMRKGSGMSAVDLAKAFAEDSTIVAYAQYLCDPGLSGWRHPDSNYGSCFPDCVARLLDDCLAHDRVEGLPMFLSLLGALEDMEYGVRTSARIVWDVRLIQSYYEERHRFVSSEATTPQLVSPNLAALFAERVERSISDSNVDEKDVLIYMKSGELRNSKDAEGLFGAFLTWFRMPFPRVVADREAPSEAMDLT